MAESVAAMLLDAAREDAKAVRALSQLPEISDTILGFHAQQSIEKALRAVLSSSGVAFRRTHDIAELLALRHKAVDPYAVRFPDLRDMVRGLPGFAEDPAHPVNEKILETIQARLIQEREDGAGDDQ